MDRRNFLRVAGGGVIAPAALLPAAGCMSSGMPAEAVQAWQGPANETDIRRWVLAHAILAPHSHNLQSWLVDLQVPGEITLYCDMTRLLPETDPLSRQIMMSQGTFLEVLDLAAKRRGHRADIVLFPQGEPGPHRLDGRLPTARIRLQRDDQVRPDPLFDQVLHRRTNREAYEARLPVPAALEAIAASAKPYAIRVGSTQGDATQLQQHRAIAKEAWKIELLTPRTIMESYNVLRVGPAEIVKHRDGISLNTPMVRALTALGLFDRSKPPAAGDSSVQSQIDGFDRKIDTTPAFFWMVTEGNDRRTQVNAGRAYVRAQLAATAQGLSMHPLSQALQEYPEQARPYAGVHALLQAPAPRFTVQMWARLGYAPAVGPTPRRGLQAHVMQA